MNMPRWWGTMKRSDRGGLYGLAAYVILALLLVPLGKPDGYRAAPFFTYLSFNGILFLFGVRNSWGGAGVPECSFLFLSGGFIWFFAGVLVAKARERLSPGALLAIAAFAGISLLASVFLRPEDPQEQCSRRRGLSVHSGSQPYCWGNLATLRSESVGYFAEWNVYTEDLSKLNFKPSYEGRPPWDTPPYRYDIFTDGRGGFLALCAGNLDDDPELEAHLVTNDGGTIHRLFDDCSNRGGGDGFARALITARDTKSAKLVFPFLADADPQVRNGAFIVLESLMAATSVESLIAVLNGRDTGLRGRAAAALVRIGGERARAALTVARDDADIEVRKLVADALQTVERSGR